MTEIFLFKVEACFQIEGRGFVLIPGFREYAGSTIVKLLLKRMGQETQTVDARIELEHLYRPSVESSWEWFCVIPTGNKSDYATGTEVWLLKEPNA